MLLIHEFLNCINSIIMHKHSIVCRACILRALRLFGQSRCLGEMTAKAVLLAGLEALSDLHVLCDVISSLTIFVLGKQVNLRLFDQMVKCFYTSLDGC